ncbi:MAG: DNA polymerase I [Dethiobacteria bacterium]
MTTSREKFIVIDGNSLLYRAFYALPPLQNRRGEHTNAVYGFTNMLFKLLEEEKPDYIAVAFDPPKPSFRVRIDETYKAQREKMPQELAEQIGRTREILKAMRIPVFIVDDFEADDVIGTLADRFAEQGQAVTVVSGDADLLQLVDDHITVMLTKKGISQMVRYDPDLLKEAYGMTTDQFIDYKALKGDPSDNIPGVPGIGDKTARNLLAEYGSIENLYENIDKIRGKAAQNLIDYRDQLFTGRDLVTLRRNVAFEFDENLCRYQKPEYEELLAILNELEFKNLASRVKAAAGGEEVISNELPEAVKLQTSGELKNYLDHIRDGSVLAMRAEQAGGWPYWRSALVTVALAADREKACYLTISDHEHDGNKTLEMISSLCKRNVKLLVHDAKQCEHLFLNFGLEIPEIKFDTHLAAYLADPAAGRYNLPDLLQRYLGLEPVETSAGKKSKTGLPHRGPWLAEEARQLFPLYENLLEQLQEQSLEKLLFELELPLALVLARIERRGIKVDSAYLRTLSKEICSRLDMLEKEIFSLAGEEFNINSPQQLAVVLFDKLKLPAIRKTKTGRSTDARVLEELAEKHEIAALLLLYRQLSKLEGTYLSGMIEMVDPGEEKIYTVLNQASTATGRLSSSDPNLQNIPIRLEEGRRIRKAFIPSNKERIFFAADYSQVELRILAHLSKDPILVEAFNTGQDIHRRTAAEVNNVKLEEVTPLMREKAKAVNFGIIYGSSDYGLAQGLKIPRAEAKAYIDSYFERYSGVKAYMDMITEQARDQGYVTTMLNRRRYLPEIHSSNHNTRSFAERMALNTPIQGSAADIIKLAMLMIDRIIEEGGFNAAMLLQIHDELLFEIEESELDFFAPLIKKEMEHAFTLSVPLQVDLKWGANWEELKKF